MGVMIGLSANTGIWLGYVSCLLGIVLLGDLFTRVYALVHHFLKS
jgi:hypothetical protein